MPSHAVGNFSGDEADVVRYRTVNLFAVVALGLGLISPIAFAGPVLWPIPIAAVVAALLALRGIAHSEGHQSGRTLAIVGLLLGTFFCAAPPAWEIGRQSILIHRGQVFSDAWIELLKQENGGLEAAHQLTLSPKKRSVSTGPALLRYYECRPDLHKQLDDFFTTPTAKKLQQAARHGTIQFARTIATGPAPQGDAIHQTYHLTYSAQQQDQHATLHIVLLRHKPTQDSPQATWQILRIFEVTPSGQ